MILWIRPLCVAALLVSLMACETTKTVNSTTEWFRSQPPLKLTESVEVRPDTGVVAGALGVLNTVTLFHHSLFSPHEAALFYIIYDPMAPNWQIEEQSVAEDTYYLMMRAKSFRTGGDGETMQILKRRALKLQREKGYADYRILDYSEGIESSTPLTHRVSEGTIQLVKSQLPARR